MLFITLPQEIKHNRQYHIIIYCWKLPIFTGIYRKNVDYDANNHSIKKQTSEEQNF